MIMSVFILIHKVSLSTLKLISHLNHLTFSFIKMIVWSLSLSRSWYLTAMTALDLQRRCHKRTYVCGGDAGGSWSSYSWGLPMAWLNTLDTPGDTNTQLSLRCPCVSDSKLNIRAGFQHGALYRSTPTAEHIKWTNAELANITPQPRKMAFMFPSCAVTSLSSMSGCMFPSAQSYDWWV